MVSGIYRPECLDDAWNGTYIEEVYPPLEPSTFPYEHDIIHCKRPPNSGPEYRRALCPMYVSEAVKEDKLLEDLSGHCGSAAHLTLIRLADKFPPSSLLCRPILRLCQMQHKYRPLHQPAQGFSLITGWDALYCRLKFPETYHGSLDLTLSFRYKLDPTPVPPDVPGAIHLADHGQWNGGQTYGLLRGMSRPLLKQMLRDVLLNIPGVGGIEYGAVRYEQCPDTSTIIHPFSVFASLLRVLSNSDDTDLKSIMEDFRTATKVETNQHRTEHLHQRTLAPNQINDRLMKLPYGRGFLESVAGKMLEFQLPFTFPGGVRIDRTLGALLDDIQNAQRDANAQRNANAHRIAPSNRDDEKVNTVENPLAPLYWQFLRTLHILNQITEDSRRRQLEIESMQQSIATSLAAIGNDWEKAVFDSSKQANFAMIILAILGAIYLPATFISTFFAMPLFNWDTPNSPMRPGFWIFWATTIPITATLAILVVILWARKRTRAGRFPSRIATCDGGNKQS